MEGMTSGLTAGIIVIGDEILKGHVQDTNSHYLTHELWLLGVKVCKISVVPDVLAEIAEEVKLFSPRYDFVLTSGGIGPTHDDVTLEAVGLAFEEEMTTHADILRVLFGEERDEKECLSNAWSKMAIVPRGTKVYVRPEGSGASFMLMTVRNVHCYPGVPHLLKSVFQNCKDLYSGSERRFYLKELFLSCGEGEVAKPLSRVQAELPAVQLGSYPAVSAKRDFLVKICIESSSVQMVEKAFCRLLLLLPTWSLLTAKDNYSSADTAEHSARESLSWLADSLTGSELKTELLPSGLCLRLQKTVATIERALQDYRFEELCLAFNGGKDCTLILALMHALLERNGHNFSASRLKLLYVLEHRPFPETEEFVQEVVRRLGGLELVKIPGSIQQALSELTATRPEVKAIFMGTRHTDPHSADLQEFSPTDGSWPRYMRLNCILDWSYSEVWLFLKLFKVPYCKLYDQGYTSLDGMEDTFPNPALLLMGGQTKSYLPAHTLKDEGLERAGRTSKACL